jgi:predicted DNA-binding protein
MAQQIKQIAVKITHDQVELLDSLCTQLRCTNSFFIRQLISNCSSELFERLQAIRLKNESQRITSL